MKHTIAEYRYHGRQNSAVALRLRALYATGLKRAYSPRDLAGVRSVLFVCHGNIIRSAMAEALLRKYLQASAGQPTIDVASAGLTDQPQERADSAHGLLRANSSVARISPAAAPDIRIG